LKNGKGGFFGRKKGDQGGAGYLELEFKTDYKRKTSNSRKFAKGGKKERREERKRRNVWEKGYVTLKST